MKKNLFLCLFALLGFLSAAAQTTGNKGFKLNVNSGDAYLDCGDITQLNKAGAYTIESWVNITLDDLDDRFIIFKKEQPDERNRIKVQVEKSGQIYVMQANGADGAYAQTSAGCYPKSGWHHIALVYDGTKTSTDEGVIILYIDGIRQAFSNAFFKPTTGDIDASFVLGGASLACYDEVRIWNKALDLETISKWKSYKVLDSHPEKANLVAYYDFQNVSETTVPDLQGAYPATFKTTEAEIKDIDLKIFEEVGEMTIESAMVSQKTGNAYAKEENIELLTLKINTVGAGELSLSGLDISLDGTTKLTDIASINVYYAGDKAQITDESFTMNYQALRPGNGKLELRDEVNAGKQALLVGNNFFIVAIRLKPTATDGGKLDGQITKLYFSNGNSITPENPNPNGDMTIRQINELDEAAYTQKCKDYNNKIVFGWFPWFSVTTIDKVDWKGLTHVAPIGFEIDKGNYTPTFEDKGIDLKWPWIDFINDAHKNGVKVLPAITGNVRDGGNTAFYVDLFGDSQKMRTAAAAIAKFTDKYNLDGINMDIEEFYNSVPNHGAKYNELIKYIKEELDKINPDFELSVATYPGNESNEWDFKGMLQSADYLTIMMYNIGQTFTCPLNDAQRRIKQFWLDINIPASDIVIAWPYYGNLYKNGSKVGTATLGDVPKYSKDNNITWDDAAKGNVYKYTDEDGANMTAYTEDLQSLRLKYDYTIKGGFKGIGIWALGQDAGMEEEAYGLIREFYDSTYQGTGISTTQSSGNISVYPTLVEDELFVNLNGNDETNLTVTVYGTMGQILKQENLSDGTRFIHLNNLSTGYYVVKVQCDSETASFRIIKK